MVNVNALKTNMVFEFQNQLYLVLKFEQNKQGRAQAHTKLKLKNLRTQATVNLTLESSKKVKLLFVNKRKAKFLYQTNQYYYFMDEQTYEMIELTHHKIDEQQLPYVTEGIVVQLLEIEKEIISIILPDKWNYLVMEVADGVKGDSQNNNHKIIMVGNGLKIKTPLFIKKNDLITVFIETGEYAGKN